MSTTTIFTPKNYHQNGTVRVEAVKMMNENVEEIVRWIGLPNIKVHKTKTHLKNITIISIEVPGYAGTQQLRYKDYLIKYTNSKDVSFLVVSPEQFYQRYESTSSSTLPLSTTFTNNPWGWGDTD